MFTAVVIWLLVVLVAAALGFGILTGIGLGLLWLIKTIINHL